jgi:hypothetical protein
MGWQTWLNSDATSAQPIASLYGLMDTKLTKDLGFINALNVVVWALRIKLNQPILKSQSCAARNAVLGCLQIRSAIHVRFS